MIESSLKNKKYTVFLYLGKLWVKVEKKRKKQLALVFSLMVLTGFAEMTGIGAVVPFLAALSDPSSLTLIPILSEIFRIFNLSKKEEFVFAITVIFIAISIFSGVLRIILLWVSTRFSFAVGADISSAVYKRTLNLPYREHVNRNSSQLISAITNKIDGITFGIVAPLLIIASSLIFLFSVASVLIIINPEVAIFTAIIFGLGYGLIALLVRLKLKKNSARIAIEQRQVIKALQEGLGGIRDVLLDGSQNIYCDIYSNADRSLRKAQGANMFIAGCPRFIMESLGMSIIVLVAYLLSTKNNGFISSIPTLGLLALGAQRILPILQNIYSSWATIAASQSALYEIVDVLYSKTEIDEINKNIPLLNFKDSIDFKDVYFRYDDDCPWVLNGISLSVKKGQKVGIVGSTGGGKSTALDIFMGLLSPIKGQIIVDGQLITDENLAGWKKNIAHVPQSIYLADTTILENIAFGVSRNLIDIERVKSSAKQAQISDFIESSSMGYETFVGERGIKLSGGQRQRIGIARALYKNTEILVLDEATSALDTITEKSVMNFIENLDNQMTVVIIAHRLSTVRHCDLLIQLESGAVVATGTYDELSANNEKFKKLTGLTN
jgi:ATP-binding cassette subfamily B protein